MSRFFGDVLHFSTVSDGFLNDRYFAFRAVPDMFCNAYLANVEVNNDKISMPTKPYASSAVINIYQWRPTQVKTNN